MGQKKSKKSLGTICSDDNVSSMSASETHGGQNESTKAKPSLDLPRCDSSNGANYSPPRSLKDIFSSESKTREFESFLAAIDQENEDEVMVTRLKFVLKCRSLSNDIKFRDAASTSEMMLSSYDKENGQTQSCEIENVAKEMQEMFFNKSNMGKRVALENRALRIRCHTVIEEVLKADHITDEMKENMQQFIVIKGQQDAVKLLEPVHQEFLLRRQKQKMASSCGVNNASSTGKELLRRLENCIL